MDLVKWTVALIGHLGLWCVAYNRIHATAWPRSSRKFSEKIILLIVILPIVYVATTLVAWQRRGVTADLETIFQSSKQFTFGLPGVIYLYVCIWLGIFFLVRWIWRKFKLRMPAAVTSVSIRQVDLKQEIGEPVLFGMLPKLLGRIPFNQILNLSVQDMTFTLDIPPKFDGLKICQLSDLHFTGQIGIEFFQKIVEKANEFEPDIFVITGDLVDNRSCLPWLDSTLGQLRPAIACYYVLGNHDRRIRQEDVYRGRLESLGLIRAAGRWRTIKFRGHEIQLTGNELPWYKGAESLPTKPPGDKQGLKILLTHSPDQIEWAEPYNFDLIFAGHTHGGQVAIPGIGPIVAPSKFGVLYAGGTFQIGNSLMHVSRGISGDEPIRICAAPELGCFTIRSKNAVANSADAEQPATASSADNLEQVASSPS